MSIVLVACAALVLAGAASAHGGAQREGAVYALTNASSGNAVAVFERAADGSLTAAGTVLTGGNGSGDGLGSQGALALDGRRLLAVNAGSNTISLLRVDASGDVSLRDTAPSGGVRPISVAVHGPFVYVLNNGDATSPGNISGLLVLGDRLVPLPGSTRPLSAAATGPAQIAFSPDGRMLVVTEKNTNRIVTYRVAFFGYAGAPNPQPSAGQTPFGFAFDPRGRLIVSEAFGGATDASVLSSYALARSGGVTPIDPNVPTTETAACWVVVTGDGRYAYATNTGSNSVSGFAVSADGRLARLDEDGKTAVTGATPIDVALSPHDRFLYVLTGGSHEVAGFRLASDGSLQAVNVVGGLPAGAVGLVAA
jgi:6-phosphogluconolactonase (cycloisomerase 2 family)